MRKIKLLAIALVLALAGFVYALGQAQDSKNACSMDKKSCCTECCQAKDSCCKAGMKQAHKAKAGCCASSGECCKGEGSCCQMGKDGKMKEGACDMTKDGTSCCGKDCCGKESCGDSCCARDKGKTS